MNFYSAKRIENSDGQFAIEGGELRLAPIESAYHPCLFRAMEAEKVLLIGPLQSNAGFPFTLGY